MGTYQTQAHTESWLLRTRRWLARLICPESFAEHSTSAQQYDKLQSEQASILKERRAYKQKVMILEEMLSAKDERLAQLVSDHERLERELSAALEARDRAKAQWRSAREDCNALYEHINQTRRSKRRQARAI